MAICFVCKIKDAIPSRHGRCRTCNEGNPTGQQRIVAARNVGLLHLKPANAHQLVRWPYTTRQWNKIEAERFRLYGNVGTPKPQERSRRGLSALEKATTDKQRLALLNSRSGSKSVKGPKREERVTDPHVYLDEQTMPGTPTQYAFIKHGSSFHGDDNRNKAYSTSSPLRAGIAGRNSVPARTRSELRKLEALHRSYINERIKGTSITQTGEVYYLNGSRRSTLVKAFGYATRETKRLVK
jgi:hypothetical protein